MGVSLSGNDLITIKDREFADLADTDTVLLDFPNNIIEEKKGKNQNSIIVFNAPGEVVTVTMRVLKGSPDDKFLNQEMNTYLNNKAGYVLMDAEFVKQSGDGAGNIISEIYSMDAGFIKKKVNTKENVEGDTEQGVSVYTLTFMTSNRSFG